MNGEYALDKFHVQELGGDLASVPSFAVQKFLMDTFQDLDND